jgi:hypothetical protein
MILYWSEGKKLDFTGLTDRDVLKCRRMHVWSPVIVDSLSRKDWARIAVLSDTSNSATLLQNWSKVASWSIPNPGIGYDSVEFYTADTSIITPLRKNLKEFQPSLPPETIVR